MTTSPLIRQFDSLNMQDVPVVGGKNASLGEMVCRLGESGIPVPSGFATTAEAYWLFIDENELRQPIADVLKENASGALSLAGTGERIRGLILEGRLPDALVDGLNAAYALLSESYGSEDVDVAVRSSATAEDLPDASFAGQHESFLNIRGEAELKSAVQRCFASLFTDRAITYRNAQGFDHNKIALSVGVQKMVRSDLAGAGVAFTLDTETGFPDIVLINGAWGLGETVVKGTVTPDQYTVFKPSLTNPNLKPIIGKHLGSKAVKMVYSTPSANSSDNSTVTVETTPDERAAFVLSDSEILRLATWACEIERHYDCPMDIEWAKDGESGQLFIVQARPETVQSNREATALKTYRLQEAGNRLVDGQSVGDAIASGSVCLINEIGDIGSFVDGSILVTRNTDPDWVPVMKRAAGIITDEGGRTSHAAIVSRELGVPAIVGAREATTVLKNKQPITLSCAEGDRGYVYDGLLAFEATEISFSDVPKTRTRVLMNIANPAAALRWWRLPCNGIGLARMEYIINSLIKIHPMALVDFDAVTDPAAREQIESMTRGYENKSDFFVENLARGIATIAASRFPDPVIVRMSDFKTNEYAHLIGGDAFEPDEENPMLGWRGASRYYSDEYRKGFALECAAVVKAREEMGLSNIVVMIPFCRTPGEADRVLEEMARNDVKRGEHGLEVYVMAEIPSNIILARDFAERFDGFSIGSNDLTQLTLGVDRDSSRLSYLFDERDDAVLSSIRDLITRAHEAGKPVGICGQGPSDHPDFATFLVRAGIDSISLLPDSIIPTLHVIAAAEAELESQSSPGTGRAAIRSSPARSFA